MPINIKLVCWTVSIFTCLTPRVIIPFSVVVSSWPDILQDKLVVTLAENLQVVRSQLPKKAYMKITSGVRTLGDFNRLIKIGYRPSKTSDHNYGFAVPLSKNNKKFKIFGETYNFAVGAADTQAEGVDSTYLFTLSMKLVNEGKCNFGQVIYEKNPETGAIWVHYGNDPALFYSEEIVKMINRTRFLKSLDGGKTYSVV